VVHACNSSTWEAEAVGSQVQGQPEIHSEKWDPVLKQQQQEVWQQQQR
jgi:hypothetical protein